MDQTIVTRNYFTDEGYTLVIGGRLIVEDGAEVEGLDGGGSAAENQSASTATAVAALKNDFNALLIRLKNAGIMVPDEWNITARLAPALTDPVAASNNGKASVAFEDGVLTVTADVNELEESESSAPGQGTHKWIGLGIGTGLASVTLVKYNGEPLTDADASEAASVGLDQNGEFVLYIRADEVVDTPKVITLKADGYPEVAITICLVAPTEETEQNDLDQTDSEQSE
jgi:hypothetical protein